MASPHLCWFILGIFRVISRNPLKKHIPSTANQPIQPQPSHWSSMEQPTITGALRRARRVFWAPDTAARPATATAVPAAPRKAKLELRREGKTMQNYAKLHGGMGIYDDLMMIYGATLSLSLFIAPSRWVHLWGYCYWQFFGWYVSKCV